MAAADPDLVAQLRPVRLPPGFDAFDWHGALAIFALALIAGIILALLLRTLTVPRLSLKAAASRDLDAARGLPENERLLHQSHLVAELKRRAEARGRRGEAISKRLDAIKAGIDAELYRPKPTLDPEALDAAILESLGKGGAR